MAKILRAGITADRIMTYPDADATILVANSAIAVTSATIPIGNRYGFVGYNGGFSSNGSQTQVLASDGGAYFYVGLGIVIVNSGQLAMANAGVPKWSWNPVVSDGQLTFSNGSGLTGAGFDVTTDSVLKIRTRAQTGYATVDALGYSVSGVAGASKAAGPVTSITIVNGIVTACS